MKTPIFLFIQIRRKTKQICDSFSKKSIKKTVLIFCNTIYLEMLNIELGVYMKINNILIGISSLLILSTGCTSTVTGTISGNNTSNNVSVTNNKLSDCATEVASIKLTRTNNKASFNTDIITPDGFNHNYHIITIDASDFAQGGTLTINGKVGTEASSGSFGLLSSGTNFVCTGFQENLLGSSANVKANDNFTVNYNFSAGQVFRFSAEGSWGGTKDAKNNVSLDISVS